MTAPEDDERDARQEEAGHPAPLLRDIGLREKHDGVLGVGPVASKGRPYRTLNVEGFEVLVGKGSEENDDLSLNVAEPHDVWMHVGGGTPGSHVVVRNPTKAELPKNVLERVAEITAYYSKARGAPKVDVEYCLASNVSKPRGAPAGLVEITNYKRVRVKPTAPPGAENG